MAAAKAGLDLPGLGVPEGRTAEHVTTGAIPAERLDELIRRILFAIFDAGLDRYPLADEDRRPALASTSGHVALATRIAAVAEANPRTVVVLNTGGPVLMPWVGRAGAVLQAWLPGQQFGEALAAVLFGDTDPGGRLPVTFPATPDQGPITGPERWPGTDGDGRYDEVVLVGYRWYDAHGQEPLFPFGHGLSYGEYEYGQVRADHDQATGAIPVTVQVTNTGARPGAEVVQLYVAAPPAAGQPPRQLKGFAKVRLDPGATTEVTLRLDPGDLAAYDEASRTWVVRPGRYELLVGRSSRDIRGRAGFDVEASRGRPVVP